MKHKVIKSWIQQLSSLIFLTTLTECKKKHKSQAMMYDMTHRRKLSVSKIRSLRIRIQSIKSISSKMLLRNSDLPCTQSNKTRNRFLNRIIQAEVRSFRDRNQTKPYQAQIMTIALSQTHASIKTNFYLPGHHLPATTTPLPISHTRTQINL